MLVVESGGGLEERDVAGQAIKPTPSGSEAITSMGE